MEETVLSATEGVGVPDEEQPANAVTRSAATRENAANFLIRDISVYLLKLILMIAITYINFNASDGGVPLIN
jgi:hypothetical protein